MELTCLVGALLICSATVHAELVGGPYVIQPLDINAGGTTSTGGPYSISASTGQAGGVGTITAEPLPAPPLYQFDDGFWSGIPVDCDDNGIDDVCDLNCGTAGGVCDVAGCGQGLDCDGDGVLDHCEVPQPVCPCVTDGDCDDGMTCTCDRCLNNQCVHVAVTAGDTSCECVGPDIDDLICVLGGFANIVDCPNGDLAPECTGDDVIDLDDLLLILAAIAGEPSPCFCGICGRACCQGGGVCTMEGPLHCMEDLGGMPLELGYCCEATPVCVAAGCP